MKYEYEEIKTALKRELAESFPKNWREKYYTVLGYLECAIKRIEDKKGETDKSVTRKTIKPITR